MKAFTEFIHRFKQDDLQSVIKKWLLPLSLIIILFLDVNAQQVEVQVDYTPVGDAEFAAYNNTKAPLFLQLNFADLENTSFGEPLPYMKLLTPGFNSLFTLYRESDEGVPRFNYQIKVFQSNPMSLVDLDFPYLIPLQEGTVADVSDVESLQDFWGSKEPESWNATGFSVHPGEKVFAARTGTIVDVSGPVRMVESSGWYNTWNYAITVLQPDGTLICYHPVAVTNKELKPGEKVYAGQEIGQTAPGTTLLKVLIYQHALNGTDLRFVIPQFITGKNQRELLIPSKTYKVVHPEDIRALEMTSREKRRILK